MEKSREKIFRQVLASIIGSSLSPSELRVLSDLLASDRSFSYELGALLHDMSRALAPQRNLRFSDEPETASMSNDNGLIELTYSIVKRRKTSRSKLVEIFRSIAPNFVLSKVDQSLPVRDLIATFFEKSTTHQAHEFLQELGVDVTRDEYLGGIGRR